MPIHILLDRTPPIAENKKAPPLVFCAPVGKLEIRVPEKDEIAGSSPAGCSSASGGVVSRVPYRTLRVHANIVLNSVVKDLEDMPSFQRFDQNISSWSPALDCSIGVLSRMPS